MRCAPTIMAGWNSARAPRPILKGEAEVALVLPPKRERRARGRAAGAGQSGRRSAVRGAARQAPRARQAQGVPPYVIFHDSVLREMARRVPGRCARWASISGVGARKLEAYGCPAT
jgi:ATP-dependent DNA helicase RecQ